MNCRECGASWEAEEAVVFGRKISPPNLCDECVAAEIAASERTRQVDEWRARLARSYLPADKQRIEIPAGPAGQAAKGWARSEMRLLVLTGPVGVGKTHTAAAACWLALQSRSVRWIEVARRMGQLRASFGDEDRAEALRVLTGDDSVILDDLDKVPATEAGLSMLFAAVDARIASGAPLLVTMNSSLNELAAQLDRKNTGLGQAIASRLAAGTLIRMSGADRRVAT